MIFIIAYTADAVNHCWLADIDRNDSESDRYEYGLNVAC